MEEHKPHLHEEDGAGAEHHEVRGEGPKKKDWMLPGSIVFAAVVIGGAIVFTTIYDKPTAAPAAAPSGQGAAPAGPSAAEVAAAMKLTSRDVIMGNASAPVTVIEYADYQCPFCTRFFTQIEPQIVNGYVKTGKVKFVFRNFPFLDRFPGLPAGANESHDAALAAECAKDQGKYWEVHDALYAAKAADEAKGGGENDGFFNRTLFGNIAQQNGINLSTFTSCIVSGKYTAAINSDYADAQKAGVNSTPTVFVNGKEVVDANGQSVGADGTAILAAIDAAFKAAK